MSCTLLPRLWPPFLFALLLLGVTACTTSDTYEAEIRRTSYHIPHITAASLADLGFGEGYAQAEDHLCSIADQVIRARGERARFFGPGEEDRHLNSDLGLAALDLYQRAGEDFEKADEEMRGWVEGFVAGYNQYLRETGVDKVPGWCRGEPWVREISANDLVAYHRLVTVTGAQLAAMIATAQPPGLESTPSAAVAPPEADRASNGWGIGGDYSSTGRGMLIANPHYPWVGSNRFWEKHLTIPGELDVYGAGLIGIPGVAIGFNEAVAWTHTVSAGERFTLYELDLVEGKPTTYLYDGEEREMTHGTFGVQVLQEDGSLATVERTLYASHYGPILNFPGFGWTETRAITFRDANEDNDEGRSQWLALNKAGSMDEFQQAHAAYNAMPWVNTISAGADGRAWYADGSATPNLSQEAIDHWLERTEADPETKAAYQRGLVLLDGSDSRFEWIDDPEARDPGVVPFSKMPQLERRDYVFNANDSYWLANSRALLTGYSPLHGREATPRTLRTRMNDATLSDGSPDGPRGEDGKFTLDELKAAILHNRGFAAMTLLPELVERCSGVASATVDDRVVDIGEACAILGRWDGRYDLDSVGAVLFREWIGQYGFAALWEKGELFAEPFDPSDPVGTPRRLAPAALAVENLGRAVLLLEGAGIPLDVPLGEVQYAERGGRRIPIHGGDGTWEGIQNFVRNRPNATTLEPLEQPDPIEGSRFLTRDGYPVSSGTSFLMALQYTDEGPKAEAFLTYSQSGDPTSEHFWDQTELFSQKAWRAILFKREEAEADTKSVKTVKGRRSS